MPARSRTYRTSAFILRRRDHQDADRILTVYTPGLGKLDLNAKGVRKTTSRKAGHLELFSHVSLLVATTRTWDIITEVQTIESFRHLRTDLDRISQVSYVAELVDAFTEAEDENQPLWDLTLLVMRELDQHDIDRENNGVQENDQRHRVLLRWYELHLLSLMGFQPEFFHCLACSDDLQPVTNYLSLADGGVYCPRCGEARAGTEPLEEDVLKVLRFLQSRPWNQVRSLTIRPHIMRQAESILYRYLLNILERQLKSVNFMRHVRSV